nr:hypothetical protein [Tanacetum cinerariifolium]
DSGLCWGRVVEVMGSVWSDGEWLGEWGEGRVKLVGKSGV